LLLLDKWWADKERSHDQYWKYVWPEFYIPKL